MSEVIVRVRNVSKRFNRDGFEVVALDNVDLELHEGDFLALMGPSGSGKSTLLNLLAGIDRPTSGEVDVLGTQLTRMSESQLAVWRNTHIGYIFQTFNLVPVLTAFENVELPLLLTKLSKAERRKNVETALDLVGLSDRMHHQPKQLSGGQEQRVAIARAIVTDPNLILADEPTGNLDARSGEEILQILSTLNHELNKTIMLVTHDPHAASFASEQMHLEKGVLTELETVSLAADRR
ncbi:MAG TPA: ABC transporter ATP-binding protein [Pyrinomonadaceae bacterium]|jgi:putative ABC transport system ATP-binding protein|nr:ABC transporter ATP-binding protein [Pyrinomonadaceae bacterium]